MRFPLPVPYKPEAAPASTDLSPETERILQALERGQRSQPQPMQPPVLVPQVKPRRRNSA